MSELALRLIEENKKTRDPYLDLGRCGLTELPKELGDCVWVETLILSTEWYEVDLTGEDWQKYESRNKGVPNRISSLESAEKLVLLKKLIVHGAYNNKWGLSDLSPLQGLSNLQQLDCSYTQVSNLSTLQGLSNLQELDCHKTQVSDLSPLQGLSNLQKLFCSNTQVSDLSPLQGLSNLQKLNCYKTQVNDLSPLQGLSALQGLFCSNTQVCDLSPLQGLSNLQKLFCSNTQVSDLSPLQGLSNLQILFCYNTQVNDLSPLQGLSDLQELNCSNTQVNDLSPLQGLSNLQKLNCSDTQVSDLSPLEGLSNLQLLYCSGTQVSDLPPLQGLSNLQKLDCSNTQLSDLSPLQGLSNLQELDCSNTQISDLSPLQGLSNLQKLDCFNMQISDLSPLQRLINLHQLDCSDTQVSDLSPLQGLSILKYLDCSNCPIKTIPADIAFSGNASKIRQYLHSNPNTPFNEVKLILSGNTQAGKSNLVDFLLLGDSFDFKEEHDSSHGILVGRWRINQAQQLLPPSSKIDSLTVNIWDFGGQDFYHGTHGMFFRNGAVYLLLWEKSRPLQGEEDICLPEDYWLEDIRHHALDSPLLCLQNKTDLHGPRRLPQEWLDLFHISVKDEFQLSIKEAALHHESEMYEEWNVFVKKLVKRLLTVPEREKARINDNWLKIRDFIHELQNGHSASEDNPFNGLSSDRPYLSRTEFISACQNIIPDFEQYADTFLLLFDRRGVLIHFAEHPKLKDIVFLHPGWVTEKMYCLLDRSLLANGVFDQAHASRKLGVDTDILLQLMTEFEVIYAHPHQADRFVAVQYLPRFNPQHDADFHYNRLKKPFLLIRIPLFHQKRILRRLIVRLGGDATYQQRLLRHDCILISAPDDTLIRVEGKRNENTGIISIYAEHPEKWGVQMALEVLMVYFDQMYELGIPAIWKRHHGDTRKFDPEREKRMRAFFESEIDFEVFAQTLDRSAEGVRWGNSTFSDYSIYPDKLPKTRQVTQIWGRFFHENLIRARQTWQEEVSQESVKNINDVKIARFDYLCAALHLSMDGGTAWVDFSTLVKDSGREYLPDMNHNIVEAKAFEPLLKALGFDLKKAPLRVFISYSKHDRDTFLTPMLRYLKPLERGGLIQSWNDHQIPPGEEWDDTIKSRIATADVILLLVSDHSLNTDYIWNVEIEAAMRRHEDGYVKVVPVILSKCLWQEKDAQDHYIFQPAKLNALPLKGKPVDEWDKPNDAWDEVAMGIKTLLQELKQ